MIVDFVVVVELELNLFLMPWFENLFFDYDLKYFLHFGYNLSYDRWNIKRTKLIFEFVWRGWSAWVERSFLSIGSRSFDIPSVETQSVFLFIEPDLADFRLERLFVLDSDRI